MEELNINNVYIKKEDVENFFKHVDINVKINNLDLYQKAFVHKSYSKDLNYDFLKTIIKLKPNVVDFQDKSNERCSD